jgi:hypothetical protein
MIPPHVRYWHKADTQAALGNVRFAAVTSAILPCNLLLIPVLPRRRSMR